MPGTLIAESLGKINLLFVMSNDPNDCGTGGCSTDVYVDEGTGYKKAFDALTFGPVYVTRTGGQVFLYLSDPNVIIPKYDALTAEFILKDHKFVENQAPPPPSPSPSPPVAPSLLCVRSVDPSPLVRRHGCAGERFWAVAI